MSRADDLAGILPRPGTPGDFGLRQGQILTYDVVTGANTISVAGTVLTNVPFLSPGTFVFFRPGDAVLLVRLNSSWAIVGRYVSPGGVAGVGRYTTLDQPVASPTATNFALATSLATKVTLDVFVPTWALFATALLTLHAFANNSTASADFLYASLLFPDGGFSTALSPTTPAAAYGAATVTRCEQVAVTPGGTLSVAGQLRTSAAAWAANVNNYAFITGLVIFNSDQGV